MLPLVDLWRQHVLIDKEVESGWRKVVERSDFILGADVADFEKEFAAFCGVRFCIGVGNGTDALEFALRALGIGSGDEVIVPANTFIATALAVLRANATVRLVDCEPDNYLIDPSRVADAYGPRVKAVLPVHLYGQMAPIDEIFRLLPHVVIVEDAAQSHGATRHGQVAGSIGKIAGTSFYPGKNLGAYGDGGAILTSDENLANRARALRSWGSTEKYHHSELGFNSRLDSLQAVVLTAKLHHLRSWNAERQRCADAYSTMLSDLDGISVPTVRHGNTHVWHLYVVRVPNRDAVAERMRKKGIAVGVHYPIPVHLQGALSDLGYRRGDFPVAEQLADQVLSLPIFPGIEMREQEYVVEALANSLRGGP